MTEFNTKSKFSKLVEQAVIENKLGYIDAVLHICEKYGVEPSEVKKFLSYQVRDKIEAEATALNFLSKNIETDIS